MELLFIDSFFFLYFFLSFPLVNKVFQECQESWKAIVIDEFQDTSAMQYGLLLILASHKRITIVGDEDQVIFVIDTLRVSSLIEHGACFLNGAN